MHNLIPHNEIFHRRLTEILLERKCNVVSLNMRFDIICEHAFVYYITSKILYHLVMLSDILNLINFSIYRIHLVKQKILQNQEIEGIQYFLTRAYKAMHYEVLNML